VFTKIDSHLIDSRDSLSLSLCWFSSCCHKRNSASTWQQRCVNACGCLVC